MFSRGDSAGHPHPSTPVRRTRGNESHGMRGGQSGYGMRCLSPVTHVCEARSMAPHPTQLKGYLVLIPPKILKSLRCQLGVLHRMLNVAMAQEELDGARILLVVGQLIPTRMPELVWLHRKAQCSHFARLGDHLADTRIRQGSLALREKDIGGLACQALEFP